MRLFWNSFAKGGRDGSALRIIWAERHPDLFELHVYDDGRAILYLNSREVASGKNVLELTDHAQGMVTTAEDVAA